MPVNRTLTELDVPGSSFYRWYQRYEEEGQVGLEVKPSQAAPQMARRSWNMENNR